MEKKDKDFLDMSGYLIDGMWSFLPLLNHACMLTCSYSLLSIKDDTVGIEDLYLKLKGYSQLNFMAANWIMKIQKYNWIRLFNNFVMNIIIWFSRWFPVLALVRFGIFKSYVKIRMLYNHEESITYA